MLKEGIIIMQKDRENKHSIQLFSKIKKGAAPHPNRNAVAPYLLLT